LETDTTFYIFGGSGDNNVKFNDLWHFTGTGWNCVSKGTPIDDSSD